MFFSCAHAFLPKKFHNLLLSTQLLQNYKYYPKRQNETKRDRNEIATQRNTTGVFFTRFQNKPKSDSHYDPSYESSSFVVVDPYCCYASKVDLIHRILCTVCIFRIWIAIVRTVRCSYYSHCFYFLARFHSILKLSRMNHQYILLPVVRVLMHEKEKNAKSIQRVI